MNVIIPIDTARERYDAMMKGKQPPEKRSPRELPEELVETFLDRLAAVMAAEYRKEHTA